MATRRPPDDDAASELEATLPGIRRLRDRDKVVNPATPRPGRAPRRAPEAPVRFEMRHAGERLEGVATGIDRKLLAGLRRGQPQPDREVDLHGMNLPQAAAAVRGVLAEALAAGERCVRVIHGRGSHSSEGPRLRAALPDWLAEPPHGARVLAFASSGDGGATAVLLRRSR